MAIPGDAWIRDGLDDLGVEPNDATAVVWQSDDIWMRNQQDGLQYQQHQNPSYVEGAAPYVYVRVRNRSCVATEATTLTVRWAKASASLGWPAPWDASVTAPAECTAAPKMGGAVGTVAVPALEPGASTIVELQWQDLPDPTQYSCFQGEETHFCLLAHIGDVSMVPQELETLVRSSNNIAWKNLNIAEDADETSSVTVGATPGGSVAALTFTDPALPGSPGSVFEWGQISVDLGPGLFARWVDGGMLGDGIESISTTAVTLGDSGGALYNVTSARTGS